ncbi:MAG: sulfurase [Solibacterales bacterium]|nr:sulfurase [Bryobacterales bacterium]|tara:strand:- start:6556 stop:7041 length:486 start_codon:yes stop_codon:yes gene_type:complete
MPADLFIDNIFIASEGGIEMQSVPQVEAIKGNGLRGDRYAEGTGYWAAFDICQVTLIEGEDLEQVQAKTGVQVMEGQHRRNLVTRGVRLSELLGKCFQVGAAILKYDRPRPPCRYIASITEQGMTKALAGKAGICAQIVRSGVIQRGDCIVVLESEPDEDD